MENYSEYISRIKIMTEMSDTELIKRLKQIANITDNDNYFYVEGTNTDVCLVCHIDTVRTKGTQVLIKERTVEYTYGDVPFNETELFNAFGIAGFDDRAGVAACIKLHTDYNVPVLFFNYEESGGRGVKQFCEDHKDTKMFDNVKLFIELDRKGTDFVDYHENGKDINDWIASFDLKEGYGSFSDISTLTEEYLIPAVNIGIGYHKEHTIKEYLSVNEYAEQVSIVSNIIERIDDLPFKRLDEKDVFVWKGYGNLGNYGNCGYDSYSDYGDYSSFDGSEYTGSNYDANDTSWKDDEDDHELWSYCFEDIKYAIRDTSDSIDRPSTSTDILAITSRMCDDKAFKELVERHVLEYHCSY